MKTISELEYKLRYDKEIPIGEVLARIHLNNREYEHFVIVEGTSDITFYHNTKTLRGISKPKIISGPSARNDSVVGKKYVINAYKRIKESNSYLAKTMDRYVFIVDHDYDGIDQYYDTKQDRIIKLRKQEKSCISCTKYYAIESYFLTEENLKVIFEEFKLQEEFKKFIDEYKQFIKETKEFFALIATTMYAVNNGIKIQNLNIKMQDIFSEFCFKERYIYNGKEYVYNREMLESAILERKAVLNRCKERKKLYEVKREYEKWIEKENYIQGHTAYTFLKEYFMEYFNININPNCNTEDYMKILPEIVVDIELNYGNGKKVG